MWIYDLKNALRSQHPITESVRIIEYSTHQNQFSAALRRALENKYGINQNIQLSKMHREISLEKLAEHRQSSGHWFEQISALGDELVDIYHRFIFWLSTHMGYDFVFEKNPYVRYHIPGRLDDRYRLADGELFTLHSDTLFGDYFQQINVWLPFCDVRDSGALNMVDSVVSTEVLEEFCSTIGFCSEQYRDSRVAFFDFATGRKELLAKIRTASSLLNMTYGQCLLFDPRVLHGTAENIGDETRVSMDFRLLRLDDYDKIVVEIEQQHTTAGQYEGNQLIKGQFYHALSARELT